MSKYLLPCECGKAIAIDASQAGQQIACECGKLLDVPTLRGVRELEPVPEAASSRPQAAEWDSLRGMAFAGSLILILIGAAVSYLGYDGLRSTLNITREAESETFEKAIDEMTLEEVYETWKGVRALGLGERGNDPFVNNRNFRAGRQRMLVVGIVLSVGGLLGAVGATLGRGKASA